MVRPREGAAQRRGEQEVVATHARRRSRQAQVALQQADRLVLVALPRFGVDHRDAAAEAADAGAGERRLAPGGAEIFHADVDGARRCGGADFVRELQQAGDLEEGRDAPPCRAGSITLPISWSRTGRVASTPRSSTLRLMSRKRPKGESARMALRSTAAVISRSRRLSVKAACAAATGSSGETSHASARRKAMVRVGAVDMRGSR